MDHTPQTSGHGIADRVRERASAQLTTQKERATDGLGTIAQAVRQSTQQLRNQQHETIALYIEQAADQLERFSTRLKEKNVSELLHDAQQLARRKPALFIGGAFALGLLGARFLKSSSDRETESPRFNRGAMPERPFATREIY
jgi:putative cell wall-binding protein